MRYNNVDDIIFVDRDGKSHVVKDIRQFESYQLMTSIKIQSGDMIDEIACRNDIYGDDAEMLIYKIFDFNRIKIAEANFDLSKITSLDIPV